MLIKYTKSHGGIFNWTNWESLRAKLNHDVFHHQFYHHFGSGPSSALYKRLANFLSGQADKLDSEVLNVLNSWKNISNQFYNLFQRAPVEALRTSREILAERALYLIELESIPSELVDLVKNAAQGCLEAKLKVPTDCIDESIKLPRQYLEWLNQFVSAVLRAARNGVKLDLPDLHGQNPVDAFVVNCASFSKAVSDIPKKLGLENR